MLFFFSLGFVLERGCFIFAAICTKLQSFTGRWAALKDRARGKLKQREPNSFESDRVAGESCRPQELPLLLALLLPSIKRKETLYSGGRVKKTVFVNVRCVLMSSGKRPDWCQNLSLELEH